MPIRQDSRGAGAVKHSRRIPVPADMPWRVIEEEGAGPPGDGDGERPARSGDTATL
jgi:hypothetical protein